VDALQRAMLATAPERRAPLERQTIGRDVIGREPQGGLQILPPAIERFPRRTKNQIERHRADGWPQALDARRDLRRCVVPFQGLQVSIDQVVATRHEREIAISAAMGAKRHVNVSAGGMGHLLFHAAAIPSNLRALPRKILACTSPGNSISRYISNCGTACPG